MQKEPFSPGILRKFNVFLDYLDIKDPKPEDYKRFWEFVILSSYKPAKVNVEDVKREYIKRGMEEKKAEYWSDRFQAGYEVLLYRKHGVLTLIEVQALRKNI